MHRVESSTRSVAGTGKNERNVGGERRQGSAVNIGHQYHLIGRNRFRIASCRGVRAPRRMQGRRVYIVPRTGLAQTCKRTEKLRGTCPQPLSWGQYRQKRASDPLTCNRSTLEGRRSRQRRDSQAAGMRACHGYTPVFFAAGVLCPLVAWVLARAAPGGAAGALHAVPPLPSPPTSPALTVGLQVVLHA